MCLHTSDKNFGTSLGRSQKEVSLVKRITQHILGGSDVNVSECMFCGFM